MPTISQLPSLADVTAADAIPVSQNGATHSVSVGALLASAQPAIISESGTLLGRVSLGAGGPEPVTVGSGLVLNDGTLTASAFDSAELPQQTTLSPTDHAMLNNNGLVTLLPVSSLRGLFSAGKNISIDANGTVSAATGPLMLATNPTTTLQAATKGYVDTQVAGALPTGGGTLTGALTLAADPTLSMQAATKHYVDAQAAISLPISGGTLTGPLALPSNPASALQAAPKQYVDSQVAYALPLAGGTLTGALTLLGDPTATLQAATKQYVDTRLATALPKTGGILSGVLTLTADPTTSLQAATKQYVDGQVAAAVPKTGGTLVGPLLLAADPASSLQAATKQYVDTRVSRSGDTLTGPLNLATDPTTTLQAATKGYVDAQVAGALPTAGGTLTGALTLAADPALSMQAATKHYVDAQAAISLPISGGTLTGSLALPSNPASALQAAPKQYVDSQVAGALPLAGGTLTGALTLPGDPTTTLQAATKQYVDTRVSRAGDTLTGPLILATNPTTTLQAATKGYVDAQVSGALPTAGGTLTGALTLVADPTLSMQAATKHYVDAQAAILLPISGGALTGPLTLPSNPASALQAAPKQYVDSQVAGALPLTGGTLTGALTLPGDPTSALQAATKRYVDSSPRYSVTTLTPVTTIAGSDLIAISQGGTDHSISYANLLDGMTIDVASTAAPASDTDLFWVGQGSSTMLAQTFATVWTWIKVKLQTYRRPVAEISINTTLDGTVHNGAVLVCSQPITLTPAFPNMGSGFTCSVVNISGGNVTFGVGIVTSSGTQTLPPGQAAELSAFTYTGGNVVFAAIAGGALAQPPGQVTGLAVGVATPSSVALTWQAPATGGAATGYTVNYRVTSLGGAWTMQSAAGTSLIVSGLAAATQYDFTVIANNAAGNGAASSVATGTTQAAPTQAPGQVTGLATSNPTASTVSLAWTAPSTGGAVGSYTVQYRTTGGTGWNVAASGVVTTAYTVTALAASTGYDFEVFAANAAGGGTPSAVASATTITAAPGLPTGLAAGVATGTTMPLSWTSPASGGAVASYSVRWSPHAANVWTTVANISGTSTTITGLTVSTSYDFEVQAVNAGGNSGWTAAINALTTGGGNYLLTAGFLPAAGSTWQVNATAIGVNSNDNSATVDGSRTVPASVTHAWSTSNTATPTTGLQPATQFSNTGHNYWATYMTAPGTPGNYYLWAIAKDSGANVVATCCWPTAFTIHT